MSKVPFETKFGHALNSPKPIVTSCLRISLADVHETNFGNIPAGNRLRKQHQTYLKTEEAPC